MIDARRSRRPAVVTPALRLLRGTRYENLSTQIHLDLTPEHLAGWQIELVLTNSPTSFKMHLSRQEVKVRNSVQKLLIAYLGRMEETRIISLLVDYGPPSASSLQQGELLSKVKTRS